MLTSTYIVNASRCVSTHLVLALLGIMAGCGTQAGSTQSATQVTDSHAASTQAPADGAPSTDEGYPRAEPPPPGDSRAVPLAESPRPEATRSPEHNSTHRNRLADETSPYLLMHAHNPVDWYAWGEEALAKAQQEQKVIFLSIGYSSCHWCHVMERESFMDEEIADFLNKHFVCIKLDREERPDLDSIYMRAVQALTGGSGGWPLSVFLTPVAKPFFGGTYFPARDGDRLGQTGFLTVLAKVHQVWSGERDEVRKSAEHLTEFIATELRGMPAAKPVVLDATLLERVQQALADQYDEQFGGFGYDPENPQRPKFPEPSNLLFLINRVQKQQDEQARQMLEGTLERMAMGGMRDHVGGGFHRYSVDRYWHIPHFEKMLYDNGQLASVYAEAYLLTQRQDFRRLLVEMLDFVLREMTSPEGAFFAALDADSEGEEGKFYRWTKDELEAVLTAQELAGMAAVYGLDGEPNFEHRYYVPMLSEPMGKIAEAQGINEAELVARLAVPRQKLLQRRGQRVRPLTDSKILTGWNGLMIRGLADAGRAIQDDRYVDAAARAASFLLEKLRSEDGRLLRTYSNGQAKLNAYVDDYAFLVDGLLALHRATGAQQWLGAADELTKKQLDLFWDERDGGFFFTSADHEALIARGKLLTDSARPAGNSVTASNLLYLARTVPHPEYVAYAQKTIQSAGAWLERAPHAAPRLAVAIAEYLEEQQELSADGSQKIE